MPTQCRKSSRVHFTSLFTQVERFIIVNVDAVVRPAPSTEDDLLGECVDALRRTAEVQADVVGDVLEVTGHGWFGRFNVEVRARVTPAMRHVVWDLGRRLHEGRRPVLATRRVSDRLGEDLRAAGVGYIDAAGNAYLFDPPTLILIRGMRTRADEKGHGRVAGRAFGIAGLRVLAVLLSDPATAALPYRDIAIAAGVSLGAASEAVSDLRRRGHIGGGNGGRTVTRLAELHRRWLDEYADRLRPKLLLGRWRPAGWGVEELVDRLSASGIDDAKVALGGEVAAALLTRNLRPATATLHVAGKAGSSDAAKALRLLPDRNGPVAMLNQIGSGLRAPQEERVAESGNVPLAHPLLVHAELAADPDADARLREAAQAIYQERLRPIFDASDVVVSKRGAP